jgi:hypothetical protein
MGDVNLQLVREFFELNVFQVLTNWQQDPRLLSAANSGQLFVRNASPVADRELPFVLHPDDLLHIGQAVVEVRAWHADRFYPSVIESNPVLSQFVAPESLALAREVFQQDEFATILVISELPVGAEQRDRSIALLQESGIGHVIEFPTVLQDLVTKADPHGSYPGSDTLQTIRLIKRYKFIRNQQMEFPFAGDAPATLTPPPIESAEVIEENEEDVDE